MKNEAPSKQINPRAQRMDEQTVKGENHKKITKKKNASRRDSNPCSSQGKPEPVTDW